MLAHLKRTLGSSDRLTRRVEFPSSMQRRGRGSSVAAEASVRGECIKDVWVPCSGEAPLSRYFSAGVVLLVVISIGLSLSGWVKSSIVRVIL